MNMTLENVIVPIEMLMEHDAIMEREFEHHNSLHPDTTQIVGWCVARVYNETHCVTFGVWHNGQFRSREVGVRNLKNGNFQLHQGNLRHVLTRFNRIARLIQAGRTINV